MWWTEMEIVSAWDQDFMLEKEVADTNYMEKRKLYVEMEILCGKWKLYDVNRNSTV